MRERSDIGCVEVSEITRLVRQPTVSVLIPAYNHSAYLAVAIEGALAQKCSFPFEILIGEDCSTDATRQIALDYQKRFPGSVRVLYGERNVGMHGNFERLVANARGQFLAICEGDDYWCEDSKLEQKTRVLASQPDVGAVHTDYHHVALCFRKWRLRRDFRARLGVQPIEGTAFERVLCHFDVRICTLLLRRSLVEQHVASSLHDPRFKVVDWLLLVNVASWSKIAYLTNATAVYRSGQGSATTSGALAAVTRLQGAVPALDEVRRMHCPDVHLVNWLRLQIGRQLLTASMMSGSAEGASVAREIFADSAPKVLKEPRIRLRFAMARIPRIARILETAALFRQEFWRRLQYERVPDAFPLRLSLRD